MNSTNQAVIHAETGHRPWCKKPMATSSHGKQPAVGELSRLASTQFYTISYLVLFSLLGTLARVGLEALTTYPGAPVLTGVIWANFTGCLIIGFLTEDKKLVGEGCEVAVSDGAQEDETRNGQGEATVHGNGGVVVARDASHPSTADVSPAVRAQKKAVPLLIGLTRGFCGCLTSFSSFILDVFLAFANDTSHSPNPPRDRGQSLMAALAIIISTTCLSTSAFQAGAHVTACLDPYLPTISPRLRQRYLNPLAAFLAWTSWPTCILLSILLPTKNPHASSPSLTARWRSQTLYALALAPPGCLLRHAASLSLAKHSNRPFPLATLVVNLTGTVVLGLAWDLQHARLGGSSEVVGRGGLAACQVLQAVQVGFCGCLTTVSTWVVELRSIRERRGVGPAYVYGLVSVLLALACLVVVVGPLRWSGGFVEKIC